MKKENEPRCNGKASSWTETLFEFVPAETSMSAYTSMRIRIWLLRLILSWWAIPTMWLIAWPIGFLLLGKSEATDIVLEDCRLLWHGNAETIVQLTNPERLPPQYRL